MPFDPVSFALAKKAMRSPPLSDSPPVTQAEGDTASPGTGAEASRYDHRHGMPSVYTPSAHAPAHGSAGADPITAEIDIRALPTLLFLAYEFTASYPAGTHVTLEDFSAEAGVDGVAGDVRAYAIGPSYAPPKTIEFKMQLDHTPGEVSDARWWHGVGIDDGADTALVVWLVQNDQSSVCTRVGAAGTSTFLPGEITDKKESYKIEWTATQVKFYKEGVLKATHTTNIPTTSTTLRVKCENRDTATAVTSWTRGWFIKVT